MHHVSALSRDIQRIKDFYTEALGLRLAVKTVNQDEPRMYHLFFADGAGSPGTEMTVFHMAHAADERRGNNSISLTTFRIADAASLAYWSARFEALGIPAGIVYARDGRQVLDFEEPGGIQHSLVVDGEPAGVPWPGEVPDAHRIHGLGYTTITVPDVELTGRFLTDGLGFRHSHQYEVTDAPDRERHVFRMDGEGAHAELHVIVRPDLPRARYGSGGVHHLAVRVPAGTTMDAWSDWLEERGYPNSGVIDRHYFTSVYVREPNDVLFELATDGPGFAVDGPIDGDRVTLPPALEPRRAEIEAALPPII